MSVTSKGKLGHFFAGDVWRECKKCKAKTWHSFVEYKKAIQVVNRSGKKSMGGVNSVVFCENPLSI